MPNATTDRSLREERALGANRYKPTEVNQGRRRLATRPLPAVPALPLPGLAEFAARDFLRLMPADQSLPASTTALRELVILARHLQNALGNPDLGRPGALVASRIDHVGVGTVDRIITPIRDAVPQLCTEPAKWGALRGLHELLLSGIWRLQLVEAAGAHRDSIHYVDGVPPPTDQELNDHLMYAAWFGELPERHEHLPGVEKQGRKVALKYRPAKTRLQKEIDYRRDKFVGDPTSDNLLQLIKPLAEAYAGSRREHREDWLQPAKLVSF